MADEDLKRLTEQVAKLEEATKKRRAKDCEHDIVVRQDPQSGSHELLACTLCDMEPKRRVAAAESIREQAANELAEMRSAILLLNETMATRESVNIVMRGLEAIGEGLVTLKEKTDALDARLAKLEAFGGAG